MRHHATHRPHWPAGGSTERDALESSRQSVRVLQERSSISSGAQLLTSFFPGAAAAQEQQQEQGAMPPKSDPFNFNDIFIAAGAEGFVKRPLAELKKKEGEELFAQDERQAGVSRRRRPCALRVCACRAAQADAAAPLPAFLKRQAPGRERNGSSSAADSRAQRLWRRHWHHSLYSEPALWRAGLPG